MEKKLNPPTRFLQVAEIELIYKTNVRPSQRPVIKTPKDAFFVFFDSWDQNKIDFLEQFKVMFLNNSNRVLGIYEASSGGITGTVADIRIILTAALKANAVSIVICHNHPSGSLMPSKADEELTKKIKYAGQLLEIKLLDHIIISSEGYYSFADEGSL